MTNRDLYRFVAELVRRSPEVDLSLDSYLRRLEAHGLAWRDHAAVPIAAFTALLEAALAPGAAPSPATALPTPAFLSWQQCLREQIADLVAMEAAGTLAGELRYFGVDAPGGRRWYNFDPCGYLECAVTGTFGGWEEGDDSDRAYVPGQVAVLGEDGQLTSMDPRDIEDPVYEVAEVPWAVFEDFLECGRCYE